MLTREMIEREAREFGATVFGVGDLALFEGEDPKRDPKMICPKAQTIVGFGIPVPRGLYRTMKDGSQASRSAACAAATAASRRGRRTTSTRRCPSRTSRRP